MPGRSRCAVVCPRAKLILYAAEGLTNVEIGARLEINPKVVGRWRRRFCEDRLDGLEDKRGWGARAAFPPQQIAANRWSTALLTESRLH